MVKNLLRNGDVISGALLAALGVYVFLQARAWDYYTPDGPGPGFFPTWYGIAMVVLSLGLVISHVVKQTPAAGPIEWTSTGRALGTWGAFALAVALMGSLGFVVSFALLTFFVVTVVFRRPPLTAALTAIGSALAFHVVFPVILSVQLPTGFLGF